MLKNLEDRILVKEYQKGNEGAFEVLLRRHQEKVYSRIYFLVKDADVANDLFQDTFVKVVNTLKAGKYNEEGKFLPWTMRIANNLVIDHFRREKKMPKIYEGIQRTDEDFNIFDVLKMEETNVEDSMIEEQIKKDVLKLVPLLSEEQREIIDLRLFVGMSFKDIAESKDISINTALGRMRYALINLRKLVKEHNVSLTLQ